MQSNIENTHNEPMTPNRHKIGNYGSCNIGCAAFAHHKYFVDISAQKNHLSTTLYTLNYFWHKNILKDIFLALSITCVALPNLKADFKSLPIVPEFTSITSDSTAVKQLFHGQTHTISKMPRASAQAKRTYTVHTPGQTLFVKIIKEDCYRCSETLFDYEWELKYDTKKNHLIRTVNAELILPNKSATFMLENKKHLITSYPWAPGKTLGNIYTEHFLGDKDTETLNRAMYRYGQVLAIAALDQNDPSDDIEELLNRTPQVSLDDRHGGNTKYFDFDDKIYLLDLSIIHSDTYSDTVEKSIMATSRDICKLFHNFINAERKHFTDSEAWEVIFYGYEYVTTTFSQFILGYISALPNYDPNVIKKMLLQKVNAVFNEHHARGDTLYFDLINNEDFVNSMQ
ncbi:MAG: hypothetical protein QS748_08720 [Candidatus Endonucleobacter bathymodioli]|uniref:Uncharacterized protein n=1 Tax=Candidatus Endonucleibacter bathymodioli TaxID=539814 RepID=A0AA90NLJ6_9GAMM|nr:hypothetical protein [Candidatus Endonucleobacter bathymodioli]